MSKEIINKLKKLLGKNLPVVEIAKALEVEPYQVYGLVQELINEGQPYAIVDGLIVKLKNPLVSDDTYIIPMEKDTIKILHISDTHLCSKYDRIDILKYLADKARRLEIDCVLHSGDFTDGRSKRPEHIYELREVSYEGQVQYCVEKYPDFGVPTYAISGNHDDWWYQSTGSDIVKSIAQRRDDIVYLGPDAANMKLGKLRIRLFHGIGGSAYAKSYKLQKYVDAIPKKERPHILQTGHVHQAFYYLQDGTHCFQTGCLQDPSRFINSMGLIGERSCWWSTIHMDDKGNPIQIDQSIEMFGPRLVKRK